MACAVVKCAHCRVKMFVYPWRLFRIKDGRVTCSVRCRAARASRRAKTSRYRGNGSREHRLIAAAALGRPLPPKVVVHHFDGDGRNNANGNLVICQDQSYHFLLHIRARVLRAGGNPDTDRICSTCRLPQPICQFYVRRSGPSAGVSMHQCKGCLKAAKAA